MSELRRNGESKEKTPGKWGRDGRCVGKEMFLWSFGVQNGMEVTPCFKLSSPLLMVYSFSLGKTFAKSSDTWFILAGIAGLCNRADFKADQETLPIAKVSGLRG